MNRDRRNLNRWPRVAIATVVAVAIPVVIVAQQLPSPGPTPPPSRLPQVAQEEGRPPARQPQRGLPSPELAPPRVEPRDPTVAGPETRRFLDPPSGASSAVPTIALRGQIVLTTGQAAAILDVAGRYYTVEEGSTVNVPGTIPFTVTRLTPYEAKVRVEGGEPELSLR